MFMSNKVRSLQNKVARWMDECSVCHIQNKPAGMEQYRPVCRNKSVSVSSACDGFKWTKCVQKTEDLQNGGAIGPYMAIVLCVSLADINPMARGEPSEKFVKKRMLRRLFSLRFGNIFGLPVSRNEKVEVVMDQQKNKMQTLPSSK